jgi:hypothetical protein
MHLSRKNCFSGTSRSDWTFRDRNKAERLTPTGPQGRPNRVSMARKPLIENSSPHEQTCRSCSPPKLETAWIPASEAPYRGGDCMASAERSR